MAGCNTPGDDTGGDDDKPGKDIDLTFPGSGDGTGQKFEITGTGDYPGLEITLTGDILDISKYANVIIDATLYSDTEGTTKATTTTANANLAQCKLLKVAGGSNWDTKSNNVCAEGYTKYGMALDGETTMDIPAGSKGVPTILLVQANYADFKDQVKSIKVRKISFVAKTGEVTFKLIFGNSVSIQGNKIVFTNASYGDDASGNNWDGTKGVGSAVLYAFPEDWGTGDTLAGKTIKFNFTIPEHACTSAGGVTEVEHQINVQAAQDTPEKEYFNGQNPSPSNGNVGQKYVTLDSAGETGWDNNTRTGTFSIPANDMIAASKANINGNDGKGPFTLDAVRITNNGTKWEENANTIHYRCKTYSIIVNSVTLTP